MEQTNLKIRKASEKDITLLYELINGLASYEKRPNDMTASIEDLEYMLFKRHIATAVIAENNEGNPLGYAIYYPIFSSFSGKAKVHIEDLFIKPEYRHQGLGKDFFYQLSKLIKDEGYIELEPANPNYSPIRIDADDNFRVWGVVVWTIKQWRR